MIATNIPFFQAIILNPWFGSPALPRHVNSGVAI
jgi:hypothetical protein